MNLKGCQSTGNPADEKRRINNVTVRMSSDMHEQLKLAAVLTGRTMSEINEAALAAYLRSLDLPQLPATVAAR